MARRRRSSKGRRRSVRRYRRNPGLGGIGRAFSVNSIMTGAKHGALVLAGKGATRMVTNFIPLPIPKTGVVGALLQGVVATVIGGLASKLVGGASNAQFFIAGGWAGAMEEIAQTLPVIGPMLAAYPSDMGAFPGDSVMGEIPAELSTSPAALFGNDFNEEEDMLV